MDTESIANLTEIFQSVTITGLALFMAYRFSLAYADMRERYITHLERDLELERISKNTSQQNT